MHAGIFCIFPSWKLLSFEILQYVISTIMNFAILKIYNDKTKQNFHLKKVVFLSVSFCVYLFYIPWRYLQGAAN